MKSFPRPTASPIAEPITLAEALIHLRETGDGGANDEYIRVLVTVARAACEERTGRTLISTPFVLKLDALPDAIELLKPPTIAVQAVKYLDEAGALQTLSSSMYTVDTASQPARIVPAYGEEWPATLDTINAVTVEFTAGYGTTSASVPAPLRHWILLAIGEMYENRNASAERPAIRSQFVDHLLDPYIVLGH